MGEPLWPTASERLNIADLFLDARVREGSGDRVALVCGERTLTYAQVQALANRFAHALRRVGVLEEQRVLIALPDTPELVAALFGTLKLGAVAVLINPQLDSEALARLVAYTRARAAVTTRARARALACAAAASRLFTKVLVVGASSPQESDLESDLCEARCVALEALTERGDDAFETLMTHRDDPALWLFSGGTTGLPKAVVQPHSSFVFTTRAYAHGVIGYRRDDVTLSVPKLFFGYATGSNLFFPFSVGARVVLFPERPSPERLFSLIERQRPTILVNVPTMVKRMLDHPAAAQADLSSLRLATSAGEALPPALYARWRERFGVPLLDGLGTAEQWHIFLSNRLGDEAPGTLGRVVEGFEVRLCDEAGRPVPDGEPGRLWVRGGARAHGYHRLPERSAETFRGPWVVTGDLLVRDTEGRYRYCGRADERLKVAGRWFAPAEVENRLLEHPALAQCCVVVAEDPTGLNKPCAFVVAKPGETLDETSLQAFCAKAIERYKVPRRVEALEALPRTHLGKVDRGALRKRAAALLAAAAQCIRPHEERGA